MQWRGWLQRWDRHNQALMSGEIPDDIRQAWKWDRPGQGGLPTLSRGGVVLDEQGVTSRAAFGRRRFWPWRDVAYLTWDPDRYACYLAVCVKRDPRVKDLVLGHRNYQAIRALLQDCEPFVTSHGARVRHSLDAGPMWWVDQPESR
jgi:hypothetical protein